MKPRSTKYIINYDAQCAIKYINYHQLKQTWICT